MGAQWAWIHGTFVPRETPDYSRPFRVLCSSKNHLEGLIHRSDITALAMCGCTTTDNGGESKPNPVSPPVILLDALPSYYYFSRVVLVIRCGFFLMLIRAFRLKHVFR